ncbi:hypothetical protein Tco_0914154 [Tanacetum coccineum]
MGAGIKGPLQQEIPSTFQEAVELALRVEKDNNHQIEGGGDNKRKRENHDDDMKKIKIISEKTNNASEYKPCMICKKTHKGNVDMRIVVIVGNRDMQQRNVKLIGLVLGVRNLDIRLLIVLKGSLMILNHERQCEECFNRLVRMLETLRSSQKIIKKHAMLSSSLEIFISDYEFSHF